MEAYFLFHRGAAAGAARAEEQDEDIGSASDSDSGSESPSTSRDGGSDDDADAESFEMAALMTQLPFKRGLSRFFDGKSQSFASLAAVASLEDLPKPPRKRLKPSRSCGAGLDARRGRLLSPRRHCAKPATAKKATIPRSGGAAFPVLAVAAVAQRRPPPVARPEGVAGKPLIVS